MTRGKHPWSIEAYLLSHVDQLNTNHSIATRLWKTLVDTFRPCSHVFIANVRQSGRNQVITKAARAAQVDAIILELPVLEETNDNNDSGADSEDEDMEEDNNNDNYPSRPYQPPSYHDLYALDKVDAVIGPSHYAVNQHVQYLSRHKRVLPTWSSVVIRPGINETMIRQSSKGSFIAKTTCVVVGYAGRLSTEKSLGLFLLAMVHVKRLVAWTSRSHHHHHPHHPHESHLVDEGNHSKTHAAGTAPAACVQFMLLGDGPMKRSLYDRAQALGLDVGRELIFRDGVYDPAALIEEMKAWHVFVHPSARETFGRINTEAMALGYTCRVVSSFFDDRLILQIESVVIYDMGSRRKTHTMCLYDDCGRVVDVPIWPHIRTSTLRCI
jgi:hypothetical protein